MQVILYENLGTFPITRLLGVLYLDKLERVL